MSTIGMTCSVSGRRVDWRRAFDLARSAHITRICRNGIERYACDVGITLDLRIDRAGCVTDRSVNQTHTAVEPGATTESADHRDTDRLYRRGTRDQSGGG